MAAMDAMAAELAVFRQQISWPALLTSIDDHCVAGIRQVLAVHASRCCPPAKAPAMVENLEVAGLICMNVTASGAHNGTFLSPA